MSASDLTAAELERRTANVRPYAGARRGVAEAIDEAHRQFGFRDHGAPGTGWTRQRPPPA